MKRNSLIALPLVFSLLAGCAAGAAGPGETPHGSPEPQPVSATPAPAEDIPPTPEPPRDEAEGAKMSANALALALLRAEYGKKEGSVILSPLSIQTALAMASEGAVGEAAEALRALGLGGGQGAALAQTGGDGVLSIANSMWFNERLNGKIDRGFKDVLSAEYGAEEGFFAPRSNASANRINGWVSGKTHGKIDSIVDANALTDDALALLVNAIYFDGRWADPFADWQVADGKFKALAGEEDARLMFDTVGTYFETDCATGFSKSYENGYQFIGILPREEGAVDLSRLDIDAFLSSETGEYDVDVAIPKFELSYANSLRDTLVELGLASLFEEGAMNAMLAPEALALGDFAQVDDVLHKTYMKMHEQGTEAAAVTAVGVVMTCTAVAKPRERKQVYLDRPFAFLIREADSGQVVFCGAVESVE